MSELMLAASAEINPSPAQGPLRVQSPDRSRNDDKDSQHNSTLKKHSVVQLVKGVGKECEREVQRDPRSRRGARRSHVRQVC